MGVGVLVVLAGYGYSHGIRAHKCHLLSRRYVTLGRYDSDVVMPLAPGHLSLQTTPAPPLHKRTTGAIYGPP